MRECLVQRIVEGAQHARDVAQRRVLLPALGERPRRLAFEIGDHEIVLRQEHLAEVIVAVKRVLHDAACRPGAASSMCFEERRAPREQAASAAWRCAAGVSAPRRCCEHGRASSSAIIVGVLRPRRQVLGARSARGRTPDRRSRPRQRGVQLGGALPERAHQRQIGAMQSSGRRLEATVPARYCSRNRSR